MPYADGTYTTPAWTNNRPPFVLADELTAMCDTAAQGQTRTADFRLSADSLEIGNDKNLQVEKAKKTFLISSSSEYNKTTSYQPTLSTTPTTIQNGFSTHFDDALITSFNTAHDLFVWYYERGEARYVNTDVSTTASVSQLFPSHGTITNPSLSINNLGIGLASGASAYLGGMYVMAYTLNGGKTWTELTNYQEWFGEVKSVTVNDDGTGFIFADGCYYFDSYAFVRNDTSALQSVNPFAPTQQGGSNGWDIANCTKPSFNRKGSGLIFDNANNKYAYTFDFGKTWTSKIAYFTNVDFTIILDSNGALIARGHASHPTVDPVQLSSDGLSISSGAYVFANDYKANNNCILGVVFYSYTTRISMYFIKGIANQKLFKTSEEPAYYIYNNPHHEIAINDNNEIAVITGAAADASPAASAYIYPLSYPTCDYGQIVTDQIAPY